MNEDQLKLRSGEVKRWESCYETDWFHFLLLSWLDHAEGCKQIEARFIKRGALGLTKQTKLFLWDVNFNLRYHLVKLKW